MCECRTMSFGSQHLPPHLPLACSLDWASGAAWGVWGSAAQGGVGGVIPGSLLQRLSCFCIRHPEASLSAGRAEWPL